MHPRPELVHHLLVELADAAPRRTRLTGHEHAEQATVRDRPAARHRHHSGVAPPLDRVGQPIPHDPWLELGELVRRVGAREHAQDAVEDLARQRLVRCRAGHRREQFVAGPAIHDGHRHELLGEDVEQVARDRRVLDLAFVHAPGDHGAFEQVAAVLREDDPLARRPDLVPGAADPLQPARHARRRFDLDDQVDRAHVDAQLQARGRDERRDAARLELLLDVQALLAGDAAVVGADELFAGQLVESMGEALAEAPRVGEDDRAVVLADGSRMAGWMDGQMLERRSG